MPHFRTSAVLVLVVLLAFAPLAIAAPTPSPAAAPYLERGLRFYATQRYADAVAELTAGYQVDPHPDFLYAIGQSHRMNGDCKAALDAYRAYLRTDQPALETQRAQEQIQRCELKVAPPVIVRRSFGTQGYVLASGGTVALGLGVVALIAGKHHASEAGRARTLEEHDSHATTARNYRIAGGVALAGGAALATLAVLRFLSTRDTIETKQPVVSASIGAGEVSVGAVFPF